MTVWALVAVVTIIVLAAVAMATVVVVLIRRSDGTRQPGPVAAPGRGDHRATAARLAAQLDGAATRAATALDFARLQLSSGTPDELAAAIAEARGSVTGLTAALARTEGAEAHGPAGTDAAGHLSEAVGRAEAAARRLTDAEARVQRETREISG